MYKGVPIAPLHSKNVKQKKKWILSDNIIIIIIIIIFAFVWVISDSAYKN